VVRFTYPARRHDFRLKSTSHRWPTLALSPSFSCFSSYLLPPVCLTDDPTSLPFAGSSLLKNFLSGGFGGMCLVLAGQPFDLIKVHPRARMLYPDVNF
jgi:hypothetical protein